MIYLLDVNVLLAASYKSHHLHDRTDGWLNMVQETKDSLFVKEPRAQYGMAA